MEKKVLGIWGAGGLGREVLELANTINKIDKRWDSIIFIVDSVGDHIVNGVEVYEYNEAKNKIANLEVIIGIGEPIIRKNKYELLKADDIDMPNLIHPDVHIPESVKLGKGIVIQSGCIVSVNVSIEDNVFLQPRCAIGHDCRLHEGCIISTFDCVAGAVSIGKYSYLGIGALVKECISIGNHSIISMGAVVFNDIPDAVIVVGNPARVMKKNEELKVFKH